ncbi:helix-turn-helix domain-containing protein [Asticcacaulis sp. YBE204]|uniref:helix-turn-helix domain-containing protein n=1 Tax=Asticcacaulis sp. YBE204 TaxID=1282363 RepID=UPI0003C3E882|nr:helix-turn-helix transcriptional regulator [Asticcacaulis sp. YBE204]ESQ79212.1 hypothetical protein AEYBE204_09390 [Asticcacaulis sp. YBE204]
MGYQEAEISRHHTVHPVDLQVGNAIKFCRKQQGITQLELAQALGKSFQQVQKYEVGANRVSASVLFEIAGFLRTPIARFFEGSDKRIEAVWPDVSQADVKACRLLLTSDGATIARYFTTINDVRIRRKLADLIQALAEDDMAERPLPALTKHTV